MSRMDHGQRTFTDAVARLCEADGVAFRRHLEANTDAVRFTLFKDGCEARLRATSHELFNNTDFDALARAKYHEATRQLDRNAEAGSYDIQLENGAQMN